MAERGSQGGDCAAGSGGAGVVGAVFLYSRAADFGVVGAAECAGESGFFVASDLAALAGGTVYLVCHRVILCRAHQSEVAQAQAVFAGDWGIAGRDGAGLPAAQPIDVYLRGRAATGGV